MDRAEAGSSDLGECPTAPPWPPKADRNLRREAWHGACVVSTLTAASETPSGRSLLCEAREDIKPIDAIRELASEGSSNCRRCRSELLAVPGSFAEEIVHVREEKPADAAALRRGGRLRRRATGSPDPQRGPVPRRRRSVRRGPREVRRPRRGRRQPSRRRSSRSSRRRIPRPTIRRPTTSTRSAARRASSRRSSTARATTRSSSRASPASSSRT